MVAVGLQFIVQEEDALLALAAMMKATSAPSMALFLEGVMAPYFEERAARRFATEGDQASGAWEPLALSTERIRAAEGYGAAHPINVRTGELMRWIETAGGETRVVGAGATMEWPRVPNTGEILEKYRTAQSGKSDPHTPARPVVAGDALDMAYLMRSLETYLINAVRQGGGATWMS